MNGSPKSPGAVDEHLGRRVRERRLLVRMSQAELAQALGLTFQQVQKYENGTNRISAGRLRSIAQVLGVSLDTFYDGLASEGGPRAELLGAFHADPQATELIEIWGDLSPDVRVRILDLARACRSAARSPEAAGRGHALRKTAR